MGDVVELWVGMMIIATAAFAPLAYFIYKFTQKNGKPFGETEPHGDSPSLVNNFAEKVIAMVKGLVSQK